MSIKQRIVEDLKAAMKAGNKERLSALRMVKSRMQEAEVSLRSEKGVEYELDDAEVTQVLSAYAKQRRDSIESYRRAGREDLAVREEAELGVVQEYLPRQLLPEEIRQMVQGAIAEAGATSPREMGAVMNIVMPKVRGLADGKLVNQMVREMLTGPGPEE